MGTITLRLPAADGALRTYQMSGRAAPTADGPPPRARLAFAAAHVIAEPLSATSSGPSALDLDATVAFRRDLWRMGLGVAEVMDTAQRGMGLEWPAAQEVVRASIAASQAVGGRLACGAGTDHLAQDESHDLERILDAYLEQCSFIEDCGGQVVLMASRALAAAARSPEEYLQVYSRVLKQMRSPVILHWLGPAFDPSLAGYWGSLDLAAAGETLLTLIEAERERIEGVKVSCLDLDLEIALRRRLPPGVRMFTGDDFNFLDLIEGDGQHHSDALLGIFAAIAPLAAVALRSLDDGDAGAFRALLEPAVPLSRHLFSAPTRFYKTGVTFLSWLNGHQSHFKMLGGLESGRAVVHLAEAFALADAAGALVDPGLAAGRMQSFLALAGVE